MRILQIYELAPSGATTYNGIDVSILELSKELSKMGHEVTILTGRSLQNNCHNSSEIEIIEVDFQNIMKKTWSPSNLSILRQLSFPLAVMGRKLRGFDIYHGHIYSSGLLALYLGRKNHGKVINTIHGSYYPIWDMISPRYQSFFYRAGERILAPFLAKHSDLQIHTGKYFASKVIEWGGPKEKIRVIRNGVNFRMFYPSKSRHREGIIFTARRLVKKNGIDYLLKAIKLVLEKVDCELWIAGDGPEKKSLKRLSVKLGIEENVSFVGLIPHDEIPYYIARSEIAVIPSLIEASSLFLLECMAMGKPIVTTKVGDIPAISDHCAILVEPADEFGLAEGLLKLLEDDEEKKKISHRALKEVKKYSWKEIAKKTEKEYLRLCEKK
jgi:glycosyltransferase involved in cell wall biosynthesis